MERNVLAIPDSKLRADGREISELSKILQAMDNIPEGASIPAGYFDYMINVLDLYCSLSQKE